MRSAGDTGDAALITDAAHRSMVDPVTPGYLTKRMAACVNFVADRPLLLGGQPALTHRRQRHVAADPRPHGARHHADQFGRRGVSHASLHVHH